MNIYLLPEILLKRVKIQYSKKIFYLINLNPNKILLENGLCRFVYHYGVHQEADAAHYGTSKSPSVETRSSTSRSPWLRLNVTEAERSDAKPP